MQLKPLAGAVIGAALATAAGAWLPHMPLFAELLLPVAGCAFGSLQPRPRGAGDAVPPARSTDGLREPSGQTQAGGSPRPAVLPADGAPPLDRLFQPVKEYLEVLEDMVISEGASNNLDDEIVEKCLALFSRIHRVLPQLSELRNDEINHRVRRLVLRDLNSFITPFLRLGGEAKMRNRRTLLNGLKDIQADMSGIMATIEHKDLLELQARADLIHQRYSSAD